jgi:membrane protease YdiL (CAAX protease family)
VNCARRAIHIDQYKTSGGAVCVSLVFAAAHTTFGTLSHPESNFVHNLVRVVDSVIGSGGGSSASCVVSGGDD